MKFIDLRTQQIIARIKQKLRLGMPHFRILIDDICACIVKQRFTFLKPHFDILIKDNKFGSPIELKGDWIAYEFMFIQNNQVIATVSKA